MKVLGIDPGYDRVGWAVLELTKPRTNTAPQVHDAGCIQTNKTSDLVTRYQVIMSQLNLILAQWQPDQIAIESLFFSKNQKTAIKVSEARGVILACILPYSHQVTEYTPNQIKLAVAGDGNADKKAVEKMIRMQLRLPDKALIDDTIDAIATAFTHTITT